MSPRHGLDRNVPFLGECRTGAKKLGGSRFSASRRASLRLFGRLANGCIHFPRAIDPQPLVTCTITRQALPPVQNKRGGIASMRKFLAAALAVGVLGATAPALAPGG